MADLTPAAVNRIAAVLEHHDKFDTGIQVAVVVTLAAHLDERPTFDEVARLSRVSLKTVARVVAWAEEQGMLLYVRSSNRTERGWWDWALNRRSPVTESVDDRSQSPTPVTESTDRDSQSGDATKPQVDTSCLRVGQTQVDDAPPDPPQPISTESTPVTSSPTVVVKRYLAMTAEIRRQRRAKGIVTTGPDKDIVRVLRLFEGEPISDDDLVTAAVNAMALTQRAIEVELNKTRVTPTAWPETPRQPRLPYTALDSRKVDEHRRNPDPDRW